MIHLALWLVSACVVGFFALLALAGIVHLVTSSGSRSPKRSNHTSAPQLPQSELKASAAGLDDLVAAVSAYQQEQERKEQAARRASEEAVMAQRQTTEWRQTIEELWHKFRPLIETAVEAVNEVLGRGGVTRIELPDQASWQQQVDFSGEDDLWFGVVCTLAGMPENLRLEMQEEELIVSVNCEEEQQVELVDLEDMTDEAIADAMARLLVPLVEKKAR